MADEIKVRFAAAEEKAQELEKEVTAVGNQLDKEEALIASIAGGWEGAGQESWHQRQSEWNKEADEERLALQQLVAAVREALGTMSKTEADVSSLFG